MKHLGDITQIHGWDVPPVDIITGGSPCQDLSIAGKRAGLDGERSGLFMEQIRIIKEMREHDRRTNGRTDKFIRPRFMVWENVCGAFSSNEGEDFRAVLEETARIADSNASIPRLPSGQSWSNAGCILGDGWSVAWRVHDAQFWGVPQRRRRISLVADFGGDSAPKVLFESKSMQRNSGEGKEERKDSSGTIGESSSKAGECISFQERAGKEGGGKGILIQREKTGTLSTLNNQAVVYDGSRRHDYQPFGDVCETVQAQYGTGGNNTPLVAYSNCEEEISMNPVAIGHDLRSARFTDDEKTDPLTSTDYKEPMAVCYNESLISSIVRRLTPLECERLQGFPDDWTDIGNWIDSKGKSHRGDSDAPRYKALGNSIALPFWQWMAERMVNQYDADYKPTMASLFDGIGGFPLVFSRVGCEPIWASEIEEFPIAVTKYHFPEEGIDGTQNKMI